VTSRAFLILIFAACMPLAAAADREDDYGNPGFYITVQLASATPTAYAEFWQEVAENNLSLGLTETGRSDTAIGFAGRLGWRATRRLAVEAELDLIPGFDYVGDDNFQAVDGDTLVTTLNARGYILPDGRFQPFFIAGLGYMQSKSKFTANDTSPTIRLPTINGFAARFGAGFDAYIFPTRHAGLTLTIDYVVGSGSTIDHVVASRSVSDLRHLAASIGLFAKF
jgi:opacity protein-like surface antigen